MSLYRLFNRENKEESESFFNLLIGMALSDNELAAEEYEHLVAMGVLLGLSEEHIREVMEKLNEEPASFLSKLNELSEKYLPEEDADCALWLSELTMMMLADGKVKDDEISFLRTIADRLGFDGENAVSGLVKVLKKAMGEDKSTAEIAKELDKYWERVKVR